jgi:hypothetical protein
VDTAVSADQCSCLEVLVVASVGEAEVDSAAAAAVLVASAAEVAAAAELVVAGKLVKKNLRRFHLRI